MDPKSAAAAAASGDSSVLGSIAGFAGGWVCFEYSPACVQSPRGSLFDFECLSNYCAVLEMVFHGQIWYMISWLVTLVLWVAGAALFGVWWCQGLLLYLPNSGTTPKRRGVAFNPQGTVYSMQ